jgi:sulfate adenylyltransferase
MVNNSSLVPPHGSPDLKPLLIPKSDRAKKLDHAIQLPKVIMSSREMSDLLLLSMGAYTPLEGFMGKADWRAVCADMKLANGLFWPVPITLSISAERAAKIIVDDEIALVDGKMQTIMAILKVSECYQPDKAFECE